MAKRSDRKSAMQIAEEAMPGWEAIEELELAAARDATEETQEAPPDMTGVDLDALRRKFGAPSDRARASVRRSEAAEDETSLIRMKSKNSQDPIGEKVAVVSGNKLVGVQG